MTLSQAIRLAYSPKLATEGRLEALQRTLALAIVATWSASCSDTYTPLAPYHAAEATARSNLEAHLSELEAIRV